jgi:hypothetical protein
VANTTLSQVNQEKQVAAESKIAAESAKLIAETQLSVAEKAKGKAIEQQQIAIGVMACMNVFGDRSLRYHPAPRMNCGLIRQPLQG